MINLNNIIDIVNEQIPSLRGRYSFTLPNDVSWELLTMGPLIKKNTGKIKLMVGLNVVNPNMIDLSSDEVRYFYNILRFCGISKKIDKFVGFSINSMIEYSIYDISDVELVWEDQKLKEQLSTYFLSL